MAGGGGGNVVKGEDGSGHTLDLGYWQVWQSCWWMIRGWCVLAGGSEREQLVKTSPPPVR